MRSEAEGIGPLRPAPLALALLGATFFAGCYIEPVDVSDRACDEEGRCLAGYECIDDICELIDAGPDDDGDDADDSGND